MARCHGDYSQAATELEEALVRARDLGDKLLIAYALANQGLVARDQGDYNRAEAAVKESLRVFREMGSNWWMAQALTPFGAIVDDQADHSRAAELLREALTMARDGGDKRSAASAIDELAALAYALAEPERAARLPGGAQAIREAIGAPIAPADRPRLESRVNAVRTALGEQALAVVYTEGLTMTPEEAIGHALDAATRIVSTMPRASLQGTARQ